MILQMGVAAQIETLVALVAATNARSSERLSSLNGLKEGYRRFLASLKQRTIDVHSHEPAYATTASDARNLATLFSNGSLLDDKLQSDVITETDDSERELKRERVDNALREISLYCPHYGEIFRTIVTDIFISPSSVARAGSTSHAIGVIWVNPKLSYATFDLMEIMLHEFTHQTVFLDELRYGHYSYRAVADRSTWAKSAILNISRPLDKVLHSAVVATEILLFRQLYIGQPAVHRVHPPTEIMLRQLDESVSSIETTALKYPGILTSRGSALVSKIRQVMNETLRSVSASPKHDPN